MSVSFDVWKNIGITRDNLFLNEDKSSFKNTLYRGIRNNIWHKEGKKEGKNCCIIFVFGVSIKNKK